jgi:hypothetical protein
MFISTKPGSREDRKAYFKNHNLPILQEIYKGSREAPLTCCIFGTPPFMNFPCIVQKKNMDRFRIQFNHVRQKASSTRQSGISVDKHSIYEPSGLFRNRCLDDPKYKIDLIEFMTMMPVDVEAHSYISQSSAYGDITLKDFPKEYWPWHLQSPENFKYICDKYQLNFLDYNWFIDHLGNIDHPSIRDRVKIFLPPSIDIRKFFAVESIQQ